MSNYSKSKIQDYVDTALELLKTKQTFKDLYQAIIKNNAKRQAVIYFDEQGRSKSYTYDEYDDRTKNLTYHLAGALKDIEKGSVIALKLKNSQNWSHFFFAILASGYNILLIDARLAHENTENLLKQASAKAIIANEVEEYSIPSFRLNEINAAEEVETIDCEWGNEVIFCSSGTTGDAKLMVMDGENICNQIAASHELPNSTLHIIHPKPIRILAMIPFHHIFGFVAVFLWYTFYGHCLVYPTTISTTDVINAIKAGKVSHVYSVPLFWDSLATKVTRTMEMKGGKTEELFYKMVEYNNNRISKSEAGLAASKGIQKKFKKQILGKYIEYCISGGGALNEDTTSIINGIGYPLHNGFGMTEIGVSSVDLSDDVNVRLKTSIGKPFYGFEYKLDHLPGCHEGEGELLIKSKTVHKKEIIGGKVEETSLEDGFFRSGDIACKDEDGYYIKGRIKDTIINANGENVYPDEIETYFKDIKHVTNQCVVGVENGGLSQIITLIIELDNEVDQLGINEIKDELKAINNSLPNEKKIEKFLIYKHKFPLSSAMKVKRQALKKAITDTPTDFIDFDEKPKTSEERFKDFNPVEVKATIEIIKNCFAKTLALPPIKIGDDDHWINNLGGDSMSYIVLVDDVNDQFKIAIPVEKYGSLATVNDFAEEVLNIKKEQKNL